MIKYLGSKRRLVPLLAAVAEAVGARTALDLFTGTTRVAQALRSTGATVTAVDTARYADVLARTYVAWDPTPAERLEVTGHMGLAGMRERITALGGTVRIQPRNGAGALLEVVVPPAPSARDLEAGTARGDRYRCAGDPR